MQILPREKLTKKARAAIQTYALLKCRELRIASLLVENTLRAERMRREDLYAWLETHGYRWNGLYWIASETQLEGEQ